MEIIAQLITSFIAAGGFGILFNAPKKALIQCGLIGMIGWILYYVLAANGLDVVPSTILAAILVAILSFICSKVYRMPIIIFNVSGIIPLVPGGSAYDAMRHFLINDYYTAVQLSTKVMLLSAGIAIGLMFSEVISQIVRKIATAKQ